MTEVTVARDLLAALEVAVLEQDGERALRLAGAVPQWLARFRPGVLSAPPKIERALGSPFLENFLSDAEGFWTSGREGGLRAGLWTGTGPPGGDLYPAASPGCLARRR